MSDKLFISANNFVGSGKTRFSVVDMEMLLIQEGQFYHIFEN